MIKTKKSDTPKQCDAIRVEALETRSKEGAAWELGFPLVGEVWRLSSCVAGKVWWLKKAEEDSSTAEEDSNGLKS